MQRLQDKIALVTGASKGIGAATAKQLAAAGASVVVNFHTSADSADQVVNKIIKSGGTAVAVKADVSNEDDIARLMFQIKEIYGRIDILVNNAGVYAFGPLEAITAASYHHEYDLNVLWLLLTTKTALHLFPADGGSIINIGSRVNSIAPANSVISSASKAAVNAIKMVLAKELGPREIRVNSLNPGIIMTEGLYLAVWQTFRCESTMNP
ncbi:SDR family NAD(P)-dependent oxidoreductase [Tunturibacter empetritectus]|uniref:3-oxoacyl-[acyl-carrier protein] reductase n=1 Tax=Tunturiibacter lichenicola TaxID=2051959 RepID=A0A852VKU3_9BACT|nr:SDR family NAD(P)-dependent oxidoreductase [Edaphobacter lichenicola]NYF92250.1 3-oxoacyl-[acyl-carrier protein] reductase [Edaphobacter lichenicola]